MLLGLCSCKKKTGYTQKEFEQDPVSILQNEHIGKLGRTYKNEKIVVCQPEDSHLKYIAADYYENGVKKTEMTYLYFFDNSSFEMWSEKYDGTNAEINKDLRMISFSSNFLDTGAYDTDFEKTQPDYYKK